MEWILELPVRYGMWVLGLITLAGLNNHGVPAEHVNIAALSAVRVYVRGGSQI